MSHVCAPSTTVSEVGISNAQCGIAVQNHHLLIEEMDSYSLEEVEAKEKEEDAISGEISTSQVDSDSSTSGGRLRMDVRHAKEVKAVNCFSL